MDTSEMAMEPANMTADIQWEKYFGGNGVDFHKKYACNWSLTIGYGGFAQIFHAFSLKGTKRPVAVKKIPKCRIKSWYWVHGKPIPLEILLLIKCQSINSVIKVLDAFELAKSWLLIMERPSQCVDLFDYVTQKLFLEEDETSHIMDQLVRTLLQMHRLGVIHRDIKEENILINPITKKIWLIDFGAATFLHEREYSDYAGTRIFAPPEFVQNNFYFAKSAEMWTLGVLLYSLVCGEIPFAREDHFQRLPRWHGALHFRRLISKECRDLIRECLHPHPQSRPTLCDVLRHPWMVKYNKFVPTVPRIRSYSQQSQTPCKILYGSTGSVVLSSQQHSECSCDNLRESGSKVIDITYECNHILYTDTIFHFPMCPS